MKKRDRMFIKNTPLVTIGISFFNAENTILDAIKSIFAQTYKNWELILIDDGSRDLALDLLNQINDPKINIISDGINKKYPARLNEIAILAKGKYIARMDADDLCSPERIELQVKFLEENPNIDLVGTGAAIIGENLEPYGKREVSSNHREIIQSPLNGVRIVHPSSLGRTEWYKKNMYNPLIIRASDYDLWLRTYQFSTFANITEPLYFYKEQKNYFWKLYSMIILRRKIKCMLDNINIIKNNVNIFYQLTKEIAKIIICGLYTIVGKKEKYFRLRNKKLSTKEIKKIKNDIKFIKEIILPLKKNI